MGGGGGGGGGYYYQNPPSAPDPQKLIDDANAKAKAAAEAERTKRVKQGGLFARINQQTNAYAALGNGDPALGVNRNPTLG